jgi:hypothetical protein
VLRTDVPSLDDTDDLWERAEQEDAFWSQHYQTLLAKYPEQFVAVVDGKVVAASTDLQALLQLLRAQRIEPTQAWTRFLTAHPERVIL